MAGDIGDAVTWLMGGAQVRRACWEPGNYLYMQDGKIHVKARGAESSSTLVATGEDLLADDWELVSTVVTNVWDILGALSRKTADAQDDDDDDTP